MKKMVALVLVVFALLTTTSCGKKVESVAIEPDAYQMRKICELATLECYYHNVAKFKQEKTEKVFFVTKNKNKNFWIEYDGIVKFGIDASMVNLEVNDTMVTITLPKAKMLDCKVDSTTLNKDSYIIAKDSADITGEDEVMALSESKHQLEKNAADDGALLERAQQQAETLLKNYITNIGEAVGKEYTIRWVYLDADGNPTGSTAGVSDSQNETTATNNNAE